MNGPRGCRQLFCSFRIEGVEERDLPLAAQSVPEWRRDRPWRQGVGRRGAKEASAESRLASGSGSGSPHVCIFAVLRWNVLFPNVPDLPDDCRASMPEVQRQNTPRERRSSRTSRKSQHLAQVCCSRAAIPSQIEATLM